MKTKIIFVICLFIVGETLGQENSSSFFGIKNYVSVAFEKGDINFTGTNDAGFILDSVQHLELKIIQPTFNIFSKKGHFHEVGISALRFIKEEQVVVLKTNSQIFSFTDTFLQGTEKQNELGLRYQFNYALINKGIQVYFGAGLDGSLKIRKFIPIIPKDRELYSNYEQEHKVKELNLHIVPRIIFPISKKVFLDFNTSFTVYKIKKTNYDRWISRTNQNNINFKHSYSETLPYDFECSIGIGYKIERKKK